MIQKYEPIYIKPAREKRPQSKIESSRGQLLKSILPIEPL